jgi:hypothetical protein
MTCYLERCQASHPDLPERQHVHKASHLSNFAGYESSLPTVIILATIAYVVFGMRVHTRLRNRAWGIDDWCMTAAIVSGLLHMGHPVKLADRTDPVLCIDNIMSRWFFQRNRGP